MSQPYDEQLENAPEGDSAPGAADDLTAGSADSVDEVTESSETATDPIDALSDSADEAADDSDDSHDSDEESDSAEAVEAAEPATDEASVDAPGDPLEEFRDALRSKPGDWFVVHTYSGMENRVKANLENRITSLNMEDYIHEVIVPTEEV
ncbi:MAG: transcription termination/antitermination NusG family protein, partial [Nocardioidaceae bacterium]